MARALNRLTVREVATVKEPGRHADGGGLYLRITSAGARSWVFMAAVEGKRAEIGLGAAAAVSLAAARKLAGETREAVALGVDGSWRVCRDEQAFGLNTALRFAESGRTSPPLMLCSASARKEEC